MDKKRIPIGIESFERIRTENCYYVDKTRFIEELLDDSLEKTDELENDEEDYYQLNGYLDMLISFLEDGQESMIDIVCGELSKLEYSGEMDVLVREVLDKVKVKDKEGVIITANKIRELTDK